MNRKLLVSMAIGILLISGGVFINLKLRKMRKVPKQKDYTEANIRYVNTISLETEKENVKIKGYGLIRPRVAVAIPAEIPGKITYRHTAFELGGNLKKGDLLFKIDPDTYQIQVQKANSQLANSLAQQEVLEAEIKGYQKSLIISSESVILAQRELQRFEKLAKSDATSKSQVDRIRSNLQSALTGKIKDENSLRQSLARRAAILAGIQQAQNALQEAKLNLGKTEIFAPFDCRVDFRRVEMGEYVNPGKVLGEIYDPRTLEANIPIAVSDLLWLLPSDSSSQSVSDLNLKGEAKITFSLPGHEEKRCYWAGTIARLAGTVEERSRTVNVVVQISETPLPESTAIFPLLNGLFVEVELVGRTLQNIYKIPRSVISRDDTINLYKDGKLAIQPIRIVRIEGEYAFVDQGLKPNDQLITSVLPEIIAGYPLAIASPTGKINEDR